MWLLSGLAFANQTDYPPLQDQSWTECRTGLVSVKYRDEILKVNYKNCSNGAYDFIEQQLLKTTYYIFEFTDSIGLNGQVCALNSNLEFYQVRMNVLNDSKRFPNHQNLQNLPAWGLYDPRPGGDVSSIILTDHGRNWNQITFAHELSHYWYDRLCWNWSWHKSPEDFAMAFEKYFKGKIE